MKITQILSDATAVMLVSAGLSTAALALGGCVVSPENPTLVLGLIGAAAALVPRLKRRFRKPE